MHNVAYVLRQWNNFHSVAGFFVCIQAHPAIPLLRKTQALLLVTSLNTLDKLDKSLDLETKNHSLYRRHLESLNDRCVPFISGLGNDMTFTIDSPQGTERQEPTGRRSNEQR